MPHGTSRLLEPLVGIATILVVTGVAVVPFLTPAWIGFEQDRAQATAWTGFTPDEVRSATGSILADLVLGPPDFDVVVRGEPVLTDREREHLRDVRGVFTGFAALVAVAGGVLLLAGRAIGSPRFRAAVGAGATIAVAAVVVAGIVASVAFDAAFDVFHRLFFSAGSYTFDPTRDRLVQLFPNQFWLETTMAVGLVIALLGLVVRRLSRPGEAP